MDTARKSAILEKGKGSTVLEGSSAEIEGEGDTPATMEREGEEATADLEAASREKIGGKEDSTHQQESGKVEETVGAGGGGGKVKQRKRKYVLKGGASALAIQLFGMDDKFEMRSVITLCRLKNHLPSTKLQIH